MQGLRLTGRTGPTWAWRLLPAATGVLGGLALPPVDAGPLILVAPVPLLVAWRRRGADVRGAAADGFVAGVAFFGIVVAWAWYFGAVAYFPFVAVLAAYWALAGVIVASAARRGWTGPAVLASVWTLIEALRGRWPFGGFSWGEFGYGLHDFPVARSVAGWGGVLLVSFGIVYAAATGIDAWRLWQVRERSPRVWCRPATALAVTALLVIVAHLALPDTRPAGTLRVAVVQGNDLNRDLTPEERADRYLPSNHFRLARTVATPVDLIVLPESSLDDDPRGDSFLEGELASLARRFDAAVMANASVEIEAGRRLENTNFLYDPDGSLAGTYVKQHLVPYGEYVPGRRFLEGIISELEQIPVDQAPGDRRRIFDVAGVQVANLICFESAFTEIARAYAGDGAEVLLVSTNNRSFRRSANSAQHLALGQMRAAETGRPLVQAAISGLSAFIDADGDILATTDLFDATTLERTVRGTRGRTPYVVFGDWILVASGLVLVVAAVRSRLRPPGEKGRFAAAGAHS